LIYRGNSLWRSLTSATMFFIGHQRLMWRSCSDYRTRWLECSCISLWAPLANHVL